MKRLLFIVCMLAPVIGIFFSSGCANVVPPQGGPRDSLPPRLIRSTPVDSSLNFTGNRISFSFDEYVQLQNIQQNLVMSPIPRNTPLVEYRLNTVTLRLKDPLEPNTTYSFDFGNAIKDINEGNQLSGFTYTFSTGPYLDSLELRGNVILAETGKVDSSLIVMLHTSPDDSAVVNEKPRYVTRLNSQGGFVFKNLPAKTFYIYALKDEGGSMRYFNERQLFAFADKPVIAGDSLRVTLYAYNISTAKSQVPVSPTTRIGRRTGESPAEKRLRYQTSLVANQQDLYSPFHLSFEQPLRFFDSSKVKLTIDSAFNPAGSYRFEMDSANKRVQLIYEFRENTLYNLVLDKDFAEDTAGRKLLKTDTIRFLTKKAADYGSLKLRVKNLDLSLNPVLQIIKDETVFRSYQLTGNELAVPVFTPGEYELRILFDENRNGKWDPGEFFGKRKQPERVKTLERRISIKANAANEFEVSL